MKGIGVKQFVMDSVIDLFSEPDRASKEQEYLKTFNSDAVTIMMSYADTWDKTDGTYDNPDDAEKFDKIIDDCVDEVMCLENVLL